jgi:hypothetical protein
MGRRARAGLSTLSWRACSRVHEPGDPSHGRHGRHCAHLLERLRPTFPRVLRWIAAHGRVRHRPHGATPRPREQPVDVAKARPCAARTSCAGVWESPRGGVQRGNLGLGHTESWRDCSPGWESQPAEAFLAVSREHWLLFAMTTVQGTVTGAAPDDVHRDPLTGRLPLI